MKHVAAYSSASVEWYTPRPFVAALSAEFGPFTLDPCASDASAVCDRYFTADDDGLSHSWSGETVYMNPPYGYGIGKWIEKAYLESLNEGTVVVGLIPAKTETRWWHDYVMKAEEIRFIKGRMRFSGSNVNAPFPSCVVVWRGVPTGPKFSTMERNPA